MYKHILRKTQLACGLIKRIINKQSHIYIIKLLVNMCLRPIYSYALVFWNPTELQCKALNSLTCTPLRKLFHLPHSTHINSILMDCGIPTIQQWRQQLLISTYKRLFSLPSNHLANIYIKHEYTYELPSHLLYFKNIYLDSNDKPLYINEITKEKI